MKDADSQHVAVGHFNISNIEGVWAVARAGKSLGLPVIIGVSEGERDFVGPAQVRAVVSSIRDELNHPIFLNADHTYSVERVKEAIDLGFDSVIFDGAKLSLEENIKSTKECVEYARSKDRDILVEGELGYIGQSSKLLDEIPEGVSFGAESLTSPEEARDFVEKTGIDLLAPAVGNMHGMIKGGGGGLHLDIERVKAIRDTAGVPLVLHGGSGNSKEDFINSIKAGVSIVHINTELRLTFRDALKRELQENPEEIAPYKFMKPSLLAMQKLVEEKISLFNQK